MKCKHCNGTGRRMEESDNGIGWISVECEYCNGTGKIQQTNEEWFCQLSTKEKAKWLADNFGYVAYKASGGKPETVQEQFIEYWKEWLKQPRK